MRRRLAASLWLRVMGAWCSAMAGVETEPVGLGTLVSKRKVMTSHIAQYRQTPAARASRALSLLMSACSSPSTSPSQRFCFSSFLLHVFARRYPKRQHSPCCEFEREGEGKRACVRSERDFAFACWHGRRGSVRILGSRLQSGWAVGEHAEDRPTGEEMVSSSLGTCGMEPVGAAVGQRRGNIPQAA